MRFAFSVLILCFLAVGAAKAETYRISSPEIPESIAIVNLLTEVYRQLGHDISYTVRPAKRSLVEVNSGRFDAELARITGMEVEYPNLVRVEEPVYVVSMSAIVTADSKIWMSSWEKIAKHRVGYPRGYKLLDIRTRDMNATAAKDSTAIFRMVKAGRVDIGLMLTPDALEFASKDSGITALEPPVEVITLYHYVNVKHRRLVPSIEKILIELNDSGRAKELLSKPN